MWVFDQTGHFDLPEYALLGARDRELVKSFSARALAYLWECRLRFEREGALRNRRC